MTDLARCVDVLRAEFYRSDALTVARELLGMTLVSAVGDVVIRSRIYETEAYHQRERGAHCYGGKRTPRTDVMFAAGGVAYVYFVYGMHWQFNVVTGRIGTGEAVLVRGATPIGGAAELAIAKRRRGWGTNKRMPSRAILEDPSRWCDGPAKLCQALAIDGSHNGIALDGRGAVWIEEASRVDDDDVVVGPRVGIDYAGADAALPWRFMGPR